VADELPVVFVPMIVNTVAGISVVGVPEIKPVAVLKDSPEGTDGVIE
jgi:hypothetical protein